MSGDVNSELLRSLVSRVERLQEEKDALTADIREVYAEAKNHGYDVKIMRKVVALRKLEPAILDEQESLIEIYMRALGPYVDTPLGEAALARVA